MINTQQHGSSDSHGPLTEEIRIVAHGFTDSKGIATARNNEIDLTPYVKRLLFQHSTHPPYEQINITLALPFDQWTSLLPGSIIAQGAFEEQRAPAPGFWVVVRAHNPNTAQGESWPALAWGRASRVRLAWQQGGSGITSIPRSTVEIQCESWLTFLGKCRILLTAGPTAIPKGHAYTLEEWKDTITKLLGSASASSAGALLADLFALVARAELPLSLGDNLHEAIRVVHDRASAARYAPSRLGQTWRVPGTKLPNANVFTQQSVFGFLSSVFQTSTELELFPSLEYPSQIDPPLPTYSAEDDGPESPWPRAPQIDNNTAAALGAVPVLIYRQPPHLRFSVDRLLAKGKPPKAEQLADAFNSPTTYGQEPQDSRPTSRAYFIERADIIGLTLNYDDAERVNAAAFRTPIQPAAPLELYGPFGRPAALQVDVIRHGLRIEEIAHPFWILPPKGYDPAAQQTIADIHTAQSEITYALTASNDLLFYARASLTVSYRPTMKAGHYTRIKLDDQEEGEGFVFVGLSGYIENVTHSIDITPTGTPIRRTQIDLSRVIFGIYGKDFQHFASGE